jgi:hypothetical protein
MSFVHYLFVSSASASLAVVALLRHFLSFPSLCWFPCLPCFSSVHVSSSYGRKSSAILVALPAVDILWDVTPCGLVDVYRYFGRMLPFSDRLCGLVVILRYRSGGPGSIPATTRKKK